MESTPQQVVTSIRISNKPRTPDMQNLHDYLNRKGFPFQFGSFGIKTKSGWGIKPELDKVRLYLESDNNKEHLIQELKKTRVPTRITDHIKEITKASTPNIKIYYFEDEFPKVPRGQEQGGYSASQTQQHVEVQKLSSLGGVTTPRQQGGGGATTPRQQGGGGASSDGNVHTVSSINHRVPERRINEDMTNLKQYLHRLGFQFNYGLFCTVSPKGWKNRVDTSIDPVKLYWEDLEGVYKTKADLVQHLKEQRVPNSIRQHIQEIKKGKGESATNIYYFSIFPNVPESSSDTTLSSPQGGGATKTRQVPQGWTAPRK